MGIILSFLSWLGLRDQPELETFQAASTELGPTVEPTSPRYSIEMPGRT